MPEEGGFVLLPATAEEITAVPGGARDGEEWGRRVFGQLLGTSA